MHPNGGSDALGGYLEEVGEHALMSAEEEARVAREKAAGSEEARRRLIEANLRLVVAIAKRYQGRGVDLDDLVQEGNMGLMRAVDGFDPELRCRFSTYAFSAIRHSMLTAIERLARPVRLPARPLHEVWHRRRVIEALTKALDRPPTEDEVALELGVSVEHLRALEVAAEDTVPLDAPVGEDGAADLVDMVPDAATVDPGDEALRGSLRDDVQAALRDLTERERRVVTLRFGLEGDGREMTLTDVAEQLGVTRERARQIEARALRKLRHSARRLEAFAAA